MNQNQFFCKFFCLAIPVLFTLSAHGEVLRVDFNDLTGGTPSQLVGQQSSELLGAWQSEGEGPSVQAGDLESPAPFKSKQSGTPQSISGIEPNSAKAKLLSRWSTAAHGTTFWFSFLFRQPDASSRCGINLNGMRVVAIGGSVMITSGNAKPISGLELGTTHLVVGKVAIDPAKGAIDTISLWVDPTDLDNLEASADKHSVFTGSFFHEGGIIEIGVESYSDGGTSGGQIEQIIVTPDLSEMRQSLGSN
jgi:hypothetical protein